MKMFLNGEWHAGSATQEVTNPYDLSVIDTVPAATNEEIDQAITGLAAGAKKMAAVPAYRRFQMLQKAAELLMERREEIAKTISSEEGKPIGESRSEVARGAETLQWSAEEAKRINGEVLPLDAASNGQGKFGFTVKVPCGIVAAITPFNFPLNLVCHKVGPGLAAGNAVFVKPASATPLTALKLIEVLLDAGVPSEALACVTGSGSKIGRRICEDKRIRKISFTGSYEVGNEICKAAGMKRVTMELGSNCPVVIMPDADLEEVARWTVVSGFANAGQVCISAQRIFPMQEVYQDFLDALSPLVQKLKVGNPLESDTKLGPLVQESEAVRVSEWIDEALSSGAKLVCGGKRERGMYQPTILGDVTPAMRISREELFGPAVGVSPVETIEEGIQRAIDTTYGLSAAIFTSRIDNAMRFLHEVPSGNIHINGGPVWRCDMMPYGGLGDSGMGQEGPKYAIESMTELKMVVMHGVGK